MTKRRHFQWMGLVFAATWSVSFSAFVRADDVGIGATSEAPAGVIQALRNEMVKDAGPDEETRAQSSPVDDSGGFLGPLGRTLGVLAGVVALILFLSRGIKRLTGIKVAVGGGDRIRVLSRAVLSSKAKVYLLQVEGKRILVGESGGQIRSLCSYPVPQEESSEARTTEMGAADQDREVFRSSLESSQTGRKNRGFVDRVMAGIRDLRREKLKLTRSDVSTIRPRRENPTN